MFSFTAVAGDHPDIAGVPARPFLKATFQHLAGIGPQREARLWHRGVMSWEALLDAVRSGELGRGRFARRWLEELEVQIRAYAERRWDILGRYVPQRLMWRAVHDFPGRTACLDLETDYVAGRHVVTVAGIWDGREYEPFVRGINLEDLEAALSRYDLLITFGGSRFDIPLLRTLLKISSLRALHVDLQWPLRQLGFSGGLKAVERQVGIKRPARIDGLAGWDAVRLWRRYCSGSSRALDTLLEYNRADVVSLQTLAGIVFREQTAALQRRLLGGAPRKVTTPTPLEPGGGQ